MKNLNIVSGDNKNDKKGQNEKRNKIIVIAVILTVVILSAILYCIASNKSDETPEENKVTQEQNVPSGTTKPASDSAKEVEEVEAGSLVVTREAKSDEFCGTNHDYTKEEVAAIIKSQTGSSEKDKEIKKAVKKAQKIIESEAYGGRSKKSQISKDLINYERSEDIRKYSMIYQYLKNLCKIEDGYVEYKNDSSGYPVTYFMSQIFYYYHPGYNMKYMEDSTSTINSLWPDKTPDMVVHANALNKYISEKAKLKANQVITSLANDSNGIGEEATSETNDSIEDKSLDKIMSTYYSDSEKSIKSKYGDVKGKNLENFTELAKLYYVYAKTGDRIAFVKSSGFIVDGQKSAYVDIRKAGKHTFKIIINDKGKMITIKTE